MPYHIEVMSVGGDYYSTLNAAANRLNGIQAEFYFRPSSVGQRELGIQEKLDSYTAEGVWAFLKHHREYYRGQRPHIIAFVNAPLSSRRSDNLFGSHDDGQNGFAVVTLHGCTQYVREEQRFCEYYMTRYAHSFVNPSIKVHHEDERAFCYFHGKRYKPDIILSMDSGRLCDKCAKRLREPESTDLGHPLSVEESAALKCMRDLVSGDFPHAIVMKGGGVKGLAFAGALVELEKHFWFDQHVGTSAGAIAAGLLACGYSPTELAGILRSKDFKEFMDAAIWQLPRNLLQWGLFPGEHFRLWIADLFGKKRRNIAEIRMRDLNGAIFYASRRGEGTIVFDSRGERRDAVAAFAVRCSMSIPLVFVPQSVDGRRTFDGGMRQNFPLKKFTEDYNGKPFIALYLGKRDDRNRRFFGSELLDIWLEGDERETVDKFRDSTIVIDPSPISAVDFSLSKAEKEYLLALGRAAAMRFLFERKVVGGPSEDEVRIAEQLLQEQRRVALRTRRSRTAGRFLLVAFFGALISCAIRYRAIIMDFAYRFF